MESLNPAPSGNRRSPLRAAIAAWCAATLLSAVGCNEHLNLGSDIVWSTDFERGNWDDWARAPGTGGPYTVDAGVGEVSVETSTERAHSGVYAAVFRSTGATRMLANQTFLIGGSGLSKTAEFPESAYYSAWYYLPELDPAVTGWTILDFKHADATDGGTSGAADGGTSGATDGGTSGATDGGTSGATDGGTSGAADGGTSGAAEGADGSADGGIAKGRISLTLLPVPGATNLTLAIVDSRPEYLVAPLPNPVPAVPLGRWFHLECFIHNKADATGTLAVWLDGEKIYELVRPMSLGSLFSFAPCSFADDEGAPAATASVFLDDVVISRVRVTPNGTLGATR